MAGPRGALREGGTSSDEVSAVSGATWKLVLASTFATIVEWYDFFIYGTAAALVFGTLFLLLPPIQGSTRLSL
jgi:hypothetical protein